MEIKLSLWLWALSLAILNRSTEAGENSLVEPPNLQCACPSDQLQFTCTVVIQNRIGATIWRGTAFTNCDENRIQLRHSNEDATGRCNNGAINAISLPIEGNCAPSVLDVTVDSSLNNKTVECVLNSNSGRPTIGVATIMVTTGAYQQVPGGVTLTDVSPEQLTFSWTQIDPSCPTVQYSITSDCGNCPPNVTNSTSATCPNLQLSTTARNCTFSVGSSICGFSGPSSTPATVTLKVPDAPQINIIPVYSRTYDSLTNLMIEIHSEMDSFSIYEGISGSIVSFTIRNSSSVIQTVPADCMDGVCENMVPVGRDSVCQSSSGVISVSAMNRLGQGRASQPITVACTNEFVTVNSDSTASTLTCQFQNTQNTNQKTCSVEYSICGEEQVFTVEGNATLESPDRVTLEISLPNGSDCYTYTITAFDGSSTVIVEGKVDPSDEMNSSSVNVAAIVVPIIAVILLVIAIAMVLVVVLLLKFHPRVYQKYRASKSSPPESPESKGGVISVTNQVCEKDEQTDSVKKEPDNNREFDHHRDEDKLQVDENEPEFVDARDNPVSDSLAEGGVQDEQSSDGNVAQPEDSSERFGGGSNAAANSDYEDSNIDGGGVLGGYSGRDDEEHRIY